jgi:large subunit ribosomal protein L25
MMNSKLTLKLQKRDITGKKVQSLRDAGIIPVSLYGKKVENVSASVNLTAFDTVFQNAGETQIIYISLDGETVERPVIISDVQLHPVTDKILHVDFRQVDLKEKLEADIPLELTGESPAVKEFGANIIQLINEIRVEALPTDLPEKIEIDISLLKAIGDVIRISDLKIDTNKIELKVEDLSSVIVSASEQQKEEVVEAPVVAIPVEGAAPVVATTTEVPKSPKAV